MLKIPKKGCGSSEEEGEAQHHALHFTVIRKKHKWLWEKDVLTEDRKRSTVTVHTHLAYEVYSE